MAVSENSPNVNVVAVLAHIRASTYMTYLEVLQGKPATYRAMKLAEHDVFATQLTLTLYDNEPDHKFAIEEMLPDLKEKYEAAVEEHQRYLAGL